jgi:hypothetical protein
MGFAEPVAGLSGRPARTAHEGCNSNSNASRLDLDTLRADPAELEALAVEDLPALLERCAVEHGRVAAIERLAHARLARELPTLTRAGEGLLTARQAAQRLGVSADYVREHGEELEIAVPLLDGMMRYDPAGVDRLRRQRRDRLPLD